MDKTSRKAIITAEKKVADLKALVDTLQAALRRAEAVLKGTKDYDYVFTQSANWSMKENV